METRTVEQVKVFRLIMNMMRDRTESQTLVALAYDRSKLIDWYNSQLAKEPYKDDNWYKVFSKGSVLEWFNPLYNIHSEEMESFGHGIDYAWYEKDTISRSNILLIQ